MQSISDIAALREALSLRGKIVFVPTMGNLHEGHLNLMTTARAHGDTVVASIFVNRLQFGPHEDFDRYPRTLDADSEKLARVGVDILFMPDEDTLYPTPQQYFVDLPAIHNELDGHFRPGHFRGVATVVLKLFNVVQPQTAIFGKKDYQQLMVIRQMVQQFALPITILGSDTVRAEDGLALSSRNGYLSAEERQEAPRLYAELQKIKDAILQGNHDFAALEEEAIAALAHRGWKSDYISIRRQSDLQVPQDADSPLLVLAACRLGKTRLIDNLEI